MKILNTILVLSTLATLSSCNSNAKSDSTDNQEVITSEDHQETKKIESTEPSEEVQEEASSKVAAMTQKRTIKDYYTKLYKKLSTKGLADDEPVRKIKITKEDIPNGYMEFMDIEEDMQSSRWNMALFRANNGKEFVAVFAFGCGGLGCGGIIDDFYIYDYEGNDITSSLVDLNDIAQYFKSSKIKDDLKSGGIFIKIPQKGTSISFDPMPTMYAPTEKPGKLPNVTLNFQDGTFKVVKQ